MPIAAIPPGVELRKISAVQKRALDDLIKKQKDSSLLRTTAMVAIPSLVIFGLGAGALGLYFYKNELETWVKELPHTVATAAGGKVANIIVDAGGAVLEAVAPDLAAQPTTPEYIEAGGRRIGPLSICKRWETDATEWLSVVQSKPDMGKAETTLAATLGLRIIKNMKKLGCDRPLAFTQAQWDEG